MNKGVVKLIIWMLSILVILTVSVVILAFYDSKYTGILSVITKVISWLFMSCGIGIMIYSSGSFRSNKISK